MVQKWRSVSQSSSSDVETFVAWFKKHKAQVIIESMLSSIREECGLGLPPAPFTTNACETANSVLKKNVNYEKNELPEFLKKLKELVNEQDREVERSLIGRGKYVLRPHYRSWQIEESKWFAMSTKQREQQLKKFTNASLVDVSLENSDADPPITIGRNCGAVSGLSVCVDDFAEAVRVPRNCLDGIWHKALELIKTNGAIVSAPGFEGNAKYVLSYHGKKPHLVLPKKNGAFSCDGECPNWKSMGICAHCVAAAETCNKLSEFIAWYKKSKKAPSLSKFAEATMPKGRGNKGNACSRKIIAHSKHS